MYRQLLEHSSLLIYPLIALVLFLAVFIAVVIRTFAKRADAYESTASLPLMDDDAPLLAAKERS
jgi:cbb3-type cytochrome oxidase subunit 3